LCEPSRGGGTDLALTAHAHQVFTSDDINAQRAHKFGLVNEVYKDKDELLAKARAMAQRIASHSPLVVQGAKIVLNYSDEHTVADGLEYVGLWNGNFIQRYATRIPPGPHRVAVLRTEGVRSLTRDLFHLQ
jgi:enoyl-CoA hydratase/carnithine racemase